MTGPSHDPSFTMEVRVMLPQMLISPTPTASSYASNTPEDASLASFFRSLPIPSISGSVSASPTASSDIAASAATPNTNAAILNAPGARQNITPSALSSSRPATDLVASGTGNSKKEAKSAAARAAIQLLSSQYGLTFEAVRALDTRIPKPFPPPPPPAAHYSGGSSGGVIIAEVTDQPEVPPSAAVGVSVEQLPLPAPQPARPPPSATAPVASIMTRLTQLETGTTGRLASECCD